MRCAGDGALPLCRTIGSVNMVTITFVCRGVGTPPALRVIFFDAADTAIDGPTQPCVPASHSRAPVRVLLTMCFIDDRLDRA